MSIQHKLIPEADLHENKGASTASAGQYLIADGLGSSSFETMFTEYRPTLSPVSVAANTTVEQSFTVTGIVASTDRVVAISKPTAQAGLGIVGHRITVDNLVSITFSNNTAAPIVPTASQVYIILIYRS